MASTQEIELPSVVREPQPNEIREMDEQELVYQYSTYHISRNISAPAIKVDYDHAHTETQSWYCTPLCIAVQGLSLLVLYLTAGCLLYHYGQFSGTKIHSVVDGLYFSAVTLTTVGYGDIAPTSRLTKWLTIVYVIVGVSIVGLLLTRMVSHLLNLLESCLLRLKKAEDRKGCMSYLISQEEKRIKTWVKVIASLLGLVLSIGVGTLVIHLTEGLGKEDSFYLAVISVMTIGYGDYSFKTKSGRIFASFWLIISTLIVAQGLYYLAEARVNRRNRRFAKRTLDQEMRISEYLDADLGRNNYVSKSEFIIYKLKEMGKLTEEDIKLVGDEFDRLDKHKFGAISLANFRED